jgi:fibro-slime domain-containing protein
MVHLSGRPAHRRVLLSTVTLLVAVLFIAWKLDTLPEGLRITYFSDADWSSTPVLSTIDSRPSADSLIEAWHSLPPETFSINWTGSVIALRDGVYTFGTKSDDGSWVYIDGKLVVDNGGRHSTRLGTGSVTLERGVHAIFIKYFQAGGPFYFEVLWARDKASLEPLPGWALSSRRPTFPRFLVSVLLRWAFRAAVCLWLATLVIVGAGALWRSRQRSIEMLKEDPVRLALVGVIAGSCMLNLAGIWWDFPVTWAGDEITPTVVLGSLMRRFTGGWFDRYPPFHFYVLSAAFSPWLMMKSLGWIHVSERTQEGILIVIARLVSVAAGAGTLVAVYVCGRRAFGKRAGLVAAGMMAVLTPFIYYAKTANPEVPYVFWFAVSLVFYLRLLRTLALRDFVLFASAATLAICTKDQAYGLYVSAPFVMVYHLWSSNRERRLSHPLGRAVLDVRLILAGATAAAVFAVCHNVPFNSGGFIQHVRDITGAGSQSYRMVERTLGGQLALLRLTARLNQVSWGWPFWLISLAGMVIAVTQTQTRRMAICLALVMVGFYVSFIDVILYVYDRYLLPVCIVQALFGGLAIDRLLRVPRQRVVDLWRPALVAGAFAYTLLYASTVDVLMIRDSRHTIERWLHARVDHDVLIGSVFPPTVLPRLDDFRSMDIRTIEDLRENAPAYYVLNADYARAATSDRPPGPLIAGLQQQTLGYRLVFRYRSPAPWPWLPAAHPDLVGPRLEPQVFSVLRDINPTIEIYARAPR